VFTIMKICVITSRFGLSGVPLAQLKFSRALSSAGHDVNYMIGHINEGAQLPVINDVNVHLLNKKRVLYILIPFIKYLKKEKPDIVFTAGDHLNGIVLLAAIISGSKVKVSGSSRVTPYDTYSKIPFTKRWVLKLFLRAVMPRADALTCVSKDMVEQYNHVFKSPPHVCVYNIIDDRHSRKMMEESVEDSQFHNKKDPLIVAAGTLEPWKGFSDLILAMKYLTETTKAKLVIFGDGSLKATLQAQIDDLNLGETVKLFGNVENPFKYFRHADVFVLSSYVEGLPNVLVEAMMCGCTPVSTDCPTGPREVLDSGKYGYLVPVKDPVNMAIAIQAAIEFPISRDLLDEVIQPFSEYEVLKKHFEVLGINSD
jgi:glycosyltransferase involved in cell wall biosynthesis